VVLDIGWSSITCGTHPPTFGTTVHLEIEERQRFGNRGQQRAAFRHGETEVLKQDDIPTRIRDLLGCERPLILLVHDEDAVRAFFKNLNIDTVDFSSGLEGLLQPEARGAAFRSQSTYKESRGRSHSPKREEKSDDKRRRTPPRAKMPVCLIDVRQLYITLCKRYAESNVSLVTIAADLGLQGDKKTMCAGNESRLLAEVWTTMASGPAIDEQYEARWGSGAALLKSVAAAQSGSLDPSDADFDPNDLAPTGSIVDAQPSRLSQMTDWDDLDDDEEEFYGR